MLHIIEITLDYKELDNVLRSLSKNTTVLQFIYFSSAFGRQIIFL